MTSAKPGKQDWYFTFGYGHEHNGEPAKEKNVRSTTPLKPRGWR